MTGRVRSFVFCAALATCTSAVTAAPANPSPASLYVSARQSLVAVQYVWDSELGRREMTSLGVIVSDDGLVLCSASAFDDRIAEKQIKDVKILLPQSGQEPLELDAEYQGRDDRAHVAFVRPKVKRAFTPLPISTTPPEVGQDFYSVGLMGKAMGYKAFLVRGAVAASLLGERTQMLVDGSLAGLGAPVLNEAGEMIGFVDAQPAPPVHQGQIVGPAPAPNTFTPVVDLAESIKHPPTPSNPLSIPWFGVFEMNGLKQDEAAYYGLKGPVAQVASVAEGGPAQKAGLKQGDLIVKLDGRPLDAGDTPEQVPALLRHRLMYYKPGDRVTVAVIASKGTPPKDVSVVLENNPARPSQMERFWADDTGLGVRDIAYLDRYLQHLGPDTTGVIVSVIRPDGPAASAKLLPNDVVLKLNGNPVKTLASFETQYKAARSVPSPAALVLLVRRDGRDETIRLEGSK